ncbi:hypothetical protein D3C73_999480 [compost metagenome]
MKTPLLMPADVINLPKGQAFALLEGGQLWKIRMPLPSGDGDDAMMPPNLQKIAEEMQRNYRTSESWWSASTVMPDAVIKGGLNVTSGE